MVTKEQAMAAHHGQEFHYTGRHKCSKTVGPRGSITYRITRVRVSGQCQTWKTRPGEFRLPVKYGLYESSDINEVNAGQWHSPEDCETEDA